MLFAWAGQEHRWRGQGNATGCLPNRGVWCRRGGNDAETAEEGWLRLWGRGAVGVLCRVEDNLDLDGTPWTRDGMGWTRSTRLLTTVDELAVVLCAGDGGVCGALEGDDGHAL